MVTARIYHEPTDFHYKYKIFPFIFGFLFQDILILILASTCEGETVRGTPTQPSVATNEDVAATV